MKTINFSKGLLKRLCTQLETTYTKELEQVVSAYHQAKCADSEPVGTVISEGDGHYGAHIKDGLAHGTKLFAKPQSSDNDLQELNKWRNWNPDEATGAMLREQYADGRNGLAATGLYVGYLEHRLNLTADAEGTVSDGVMKNEHLIEAFVDGYNLSYNEPREILTDEANTEAAWQVSRSRAPFCDKKGTRIWSASTPSEAINKCKTDLESMLQERNHEYD